MTELVCSGSGQGWGAEEGGSLEEAALQLGLEEVGEGRDMSRQKEEHRVGEEGDPGCRRGLGSVLCNAGSWVSLQEGVAVRARHLSSCWRRQGARAGLSGEQ